MLGKADIDISQLIAAPSDTPSGVGGADFMPPSVNLGRIVPPLLDVRVIGDGPFYSDPDGLCPLPRGCRQALGPSAVA